MQGLATDATVDFVPGATTVAEFVASEGDLALPYTVRFEEMGPPLRTSFRTILPLPTDIPAAPAAVRGPSTFNACELLYLPFAPTPPPVTPFPST